MTPHVEIVDRKSFEQALDRALSESARLKQERRGTFYWGVFPSAELELHSIQHWTRDGRVPTPEQRSSINIHVRLARMFDRIDPDDFELKNYESIVQDVALYAKYLPSEEALARGDDDPWDPDGDIDADLEEVAERLRLTPMSEQRRLLELDDIPYPDDAGFPGQPKP